MNTKQQKLDRLKKFTDQTIQEITENQQSFKKFLDFQARLYKYRFEDALLIYAQNPNAQACATYEQWNSKKIGRRIYGGSKAMHVFADKVNHIAKYLLYCTCRGKYGNYRR